jgi:hypothetical protein
MEYVSVTQNVLFDNAVLAALMFGRLYGALPQNGDCLRKSGMRSLVTCYQNVVTELNMEKIPLHIMLSDVG